MSDPNRILPRAMSMMTHDQGMMPCIVTTSTAIHTVELGTGHYAALVMNSAESPLGAVAFLNREEVEAQIQLLRNAIDDAERLDAGKVPIHATPSLRRN
jgi:hypothetical protein